PLACLAATVEYRGLADVSDELAAGDAAALARFLIRRGVLAGDPGPLPPPRAEATPLDAVDQVRATRAGIVVCAAAPGQQVQTGDLVATLVDPLAEPGEAVRSELRSRTSGVLFARTRRRLARPGDIIAKIAGTEPFPDRKRNLLGD